LAQSSNARHRLRRTVLAATLGTVCEPDVVPFVEPAAAQALQATGASSKAP
jgi:hypothetical protein